MCCEGFKRNIFGANGRDDRRNDAAPPVRSPLGVNIDHPEGVKEGRTQIQEESSTTTATSTKVQFETSSSFLTTTLLNMDNPTTRFPLRVGKQVQPARGLIRNRVQPATSTQGQPAVSTQGQPVGNSNVPYTVRSTAGYKGQSTLKHSQSEQIFKAKYKQSRWQQRSPS